eukprot:m.358114 g.358114  ORF g.358114 m.358114 type:complete len:125 (+) comp20757_c0_seq19:2296-2670(+)
MGCGESLSVAKMIIALMNPSSCAFRCYLFLFDNDCSTFGHVSADMGVCVLKVVTTFPRADGSAIMTSISAAIASSASLRKRLTSPTISSISSAADKYVSLGIALVTMKVHLSASVLQLPCISYS